MQPTASSSHQASHALVVQSVLRFLNILIVPITFLNGLGAAALFLMMIVAFLDVVMRYFFNNPISGAKDMIELLMIVLVFFSISYTQLQKGHVGIDFFIIKLPKLWQNTINAIIYIVSCFIFILVSWLNLHEALNFYKRNQATMELEIPVYPFFVTIAVGSLMLSIVLLKDALESIDENIKLGFTKHQWMTFFASLIIIFLGAVFWSIQTSFQPPAYTVGIFGVLFFIMFLTTGIPIGFLLLAVSVLGLANIRGIEPAFSILGTVLFRNTGSYAWSVFPLFVLMGYFCYFLDITRDLFESGYRFLGRLPGGLGIATIGSCTAFGAIAGDNGAGAATMGVVAFPELKKYRYKTTLAMGSIVGGGTLEFLIPPSIGMILYGVLAEQSIADLFIAGIVPGILSASLFSLYIYTLCRFRPEYGPRGARFTLREKISSLKNTWAVILLFFVVIGGLYGGVFTPTEAGGVGAAIALILGFFMQRLTIKKFYSALKETGRISAMVFIILGGAVLFGYFLTASQVTLKLAQYVVSLQVPPVFILICILMVFFVLGFFMPGSAILLINIPIFLPIVKSLGYDLIWFGVLCVMMQNVGACTPPFGFVVYAVKGVAPEVPLSDIFRGAFPFVLIMIFMVILTIIFPQIATWLPYSLK